MTLPSCEWTGALTISVGGPGWTLPVTGEGAT